LFKKQQNKKIKKRMGKISAAKKKERRKDFQKVKFKVGKKLPKNLNETRATFKAKTLILKKQFTTDKEGPVSHRNLSWKVRHTPLHPPTPIH